MEEEKVKESSFNQGVNRLSDLVRDEVQKMEVKKQVVINEGIESWLPTEQTELPAPVYPLNPPSLHVAPHPNNARHH